MNYIFHKLINRIVEIYIDDAVVKSKGYKEHLANLRETLECIRKYGLKMNPNKYAFGVSAGQFLGFMSTIEESKLAKKVWKQLMRQCPRLLKQSYNICLVRLILSGGLFQICQKRFCRFLLCWSWKMIKNLNGVTCNKRHLRR